ncbi:MAG: DUF3536 domain-containing protein [Sandaracinaceae bacterium]|nr:DUF3536 domain-containing protein [Sandaracinaceae bacterium]
MRARAQARRRLGGHGRPARRSAAALPRQAPPPAGASRSSSTTGPSRAPWPSSACSTTATASPSGCSAPSCGATSRSSCTSPPTARPTATTTRTARWRSPSRSRGLERERSITLTNYGQLLELHPPKWECEIAENTSWSCSHGVERWRSDCGCNSGTGWHQRWRAPLRAALDWLRDELAPLYEREAAPLLARPWEARDAYVDVVLDRTAPSVAAFFAAHAARELTAEERRRALSLLEMQRHAMLMYTSCGWFFDELSGLETVQVLRYAARAIQLAEALAGATLEPGFRERLARAPSNRPEHRDGDGVYEALVVPAKVELSNVGACFAIETVWPDAPDRPSIGGFDGEILERDLAHTGVSKLSLGLLRVRSRVTMEQEDYDFAVLHLGDHNLLGGIRPFTNAARHVASHSALSQAFSRADLTEVVRHIERLYDGETFSLRTLFHDEQASLLERLLADRTAAVEEMYESIYQQAAPLMRFLQSLEQPAPPVFRAAAEYTLMARLKRELGSGRDLDLRRVSDLVEEARGGERRARPRGPRAGPARDADGAAP